MRTLVALLIATGLACGGTQPSAKTAPAGGGATATDGSGAAAPATPEAKMVDDLAALRWSELGDPVIKWDAIPPVRASAEKPHRLLVVLVEFADLDFERFRGDKDQGQKLAAYYQKRLFDDTYQRRNTLSHYYAVESDGAYHVTGTVLPPVKLSKKRRAYGSPNRPAGGDWRNDSDTMGMVEESLRLAVKAHPDFDWSGYDRWDPTDFDGDHVTDEADGYLDHFVLVFAGGGQSSCQLLTHLGEALTPNVGNEALAKLGPRQRECADRLWPHRASVRLREGSGPSVDGVADARGGVPLTDKLWVYDYNMQSEYTESSTFIHEFGHSIGLPDIYSRTSSNSTGAWEVMSGTADPSPQSLSAWSRLQLGWLKPEIIRPPAFGGAPSGEIALANLEDSGADAPRAAMIILPPKKKIIDLGRLPQSSGKLAMYSGQGNELSRTATRTYDLSGLEKAEVRFDAWWEIEAGWDFAYVEASADGKSWKRLLPIDRRHMPAKHGHDGKNTLPGFTGLSGDLDGDGKDESQKGCDPKAEIEHGEDRAGAAHSPCLDPSWVHVAFDLGAYAGKPGVRFRVRYFTDGAAVERGILVDNVALWGAAAGDKLAQKSLESFEAAKPEGWAFDGFSPSPGRHEILVPHFYLAEYRNPYADLGYDRALAEPSLSFYWDPEKKRMLAVELKKRPGVVLWYFDGAYAWSENDPAINGPGKGDLLVVDSNPNEIPLPGFTRYLRGSADGFDSHYEVGGDDAQAALAASWKKTVCFVRTRKYLPRRGLPERRPCPGGVARVQKIERDGKKLTYSYEVINEFLPGARDGLKKVGELVDTRLRKGVLSYRLRDRSLRHYHTYDAPFASEPFERGIVIYQVKGDKLVELEARDYPATASFSDQVPGRWLNPKLPFDGVALPQTGFAMDVKAGGDGAAATLDYRWEK